MRRLLPALAAALVLSACSSDSEDSPTESTPTTLGEVATVSEVKDAAVDAGYSCPNWEQSNHVRRAAESGSCDDSDSFSTYLSTDARDETVQTLKDLTADIEDDEPSTLLVGPNWIINSPDAADLGDSLGGTLVTF